MPAVDLVFLRHENEENHGKVRLLSEHLHIIPKMLNAGNFYTKDLLRQSRKSFQQFAGVRVHWKKLNFTLFWKAAAKSIECFSDFEARHNGLLGRRYSRKNPAI